MTYLQRVIVHQEQQQLVQDERMERLEQMLNETANQLQQQQIENKMMMVAMSQKLTENEERSAELIRGQHVQDERMERLEQMLNESLEGQRRQEMQVGQLQQQQVEHQLTILAVSQKLTENEERCAELVRDQVGSMMQLGNVSLEQLRDDVARQMSAQQLQQQARDDVLLGKMMELADSTTQSERSLVAKYEEVQSSVSENISQLLGALTGVKQGQSQIMEVVAGDSNEIQVGLSAFKMKFARVMSDNCWVET